MMGAKIYGEAALPRLKLIFAFSFKKLNDVNRNGVVKENRDLEIWDMAF